MPKKKEHADPLPKHIRDELRMTCALWYYSSLRQGEGKKVKDLWISMSDLYHGNNTSIPSQLLLLSNGSFSYKDLFDDHVETTTKKPVNVMTLKKMSQIITIERFV